MNDDENNDTVEDGERTLRDEFSDIDMAAAGHLNGKKTMTARTKGVMRFPTILLQPPIAMATDLKAQLDTALNLTNSARDRFDDKEEFQSGVVAVARARFQYGCY